MPCSSSIRATSSGSSCPAWSTTRSPAATRTSGPPNGWSVGARRVSSSPTPHRRCTCTSTETMGHAVCGLVGAVELRLPAERVILPHEDVIAGIVADRLAMMTASQANLEPILLVYDGEGETAPWIDAVRAGQPVADVRCADGTYHRLWSMDGPGDLRAVRDLLAPHQALIADGHHRYATYLAAQGRALVGGRRPRACGSRSGALDRPVTVATCRERHPSQRVGDRPRLPHGALGVCSRREGARSRQRAVDSVARG